ncbi:MAG: Para-nitrophenol 4-monooxygenase [Alphaproteobacteria bacterium MarineAlpha11_Bin1]|nr:MAG: Para-nitrophenol 4-monooxygenase [Alphaproteobacteria bacterium MarineAlpha11_Bin1]|tara:strand:- start:25131 stop:26330 length:1200 start_codon:yes stop_codon:yes gene_type:complete
MSENERVLISGAGPVGCCAALFLAQRGIPVTLLEAAAELPEDLRASTFHPPTLDMVEELGIVDQLIEQGIVCPKWQYRDTREGVIAEWDLGVLEGDTRHPYRIQCEQYKLTRIIIRELEKLDNVEILFQVRGTSASQDDHGVTLAVETLDGMDELNGRYLIAADGASSAIRISQGIDFPGLTFPELWLCTSSEFSFEDHFENLAPIAYIADPTFWFVFVRVPGLWRLLLPSRPGETAESLVSDETVQDRMHQVCPIDQEYNTFHRTAYAVHQRVAETYRKGRVFLAGDSAHINNPLGGMGMNGGIHDAINLSDKIVRVWNGEVSDGEFDKYNAQRRPIAIEYVQQTTLRNKAMLEETDPEARRAKHDEMRATVADPKLAREYLRQSSMITALERANSLA